MGKQSHVCSFCQGAGHTRATCPLPGAALLRTLLQQAEYRRGRVSKQEGRSKPKFSPGSFGGLKKKLRLAYSGKKKPRTDNLPSASRKCKLFGHRLDCAQQVLEDLVAEGLLRFPKKCLCCRRGRYPRQVLYLPARQRADGQAVFSQGQYVLRCDCCGHRLNTVALGPWGKKFRSKMNLLQLDTFFSEYVRSTSRPLSATTAGRLCQVGLRASRVFLDFFLQKAAEAGFVALLLFPQVPELFPLLLLFFFCLSRGWAAPERALVRGPLSFRTFRGQGEGSLQKSLASLYARLMRPACASTTSAAKIPFGQPKSKSGSMFPRTDARNCRSTFRSGVLASSCLPCVCFLEQSMTCAGLRAPLRRHPSPNRLLAGCQAQGEVDAAWWQAAARRGSGSPSDQLAAEPPTEIHSRDGQCALLRPHRAESPACQEVQACVSQPSCQRVQPPAKPGRSETPHEEVSVRRDAAVGLHVAPLEDMATSQHDQEEPSVPSLQSGLL